MKGRIPRLELIQRNHTSGYEDLEDQNLYPTDFCFIISIFMLEKVEGRCTSQWKVQPVTRKHLGHTIFQNFFSWDWLPSWGPNQIHAYTINIYKNFPQTVLHDTLLHCCRADVFMYLKIIHDWWLIRKHPRRDYLRKQISCNWSWRMLEINEKKCITGNKE